mgnify:CR=1 FL=1
MTPEQTKALTDLLANIITGLYREMGKEWCEEMYSNLDKIKQTTPPPASTEGQDEMWEEVNGIFAKHYEAYNYPSQAIKEMMKRFTITRKK